MVMAMVKHIGAPKASIDGFTNSPRSGVKQAQVISRYGSDSRKHYQDQRWHKARAFVLTLHGSVCLYCKQAKADLVDHHQPAVTGIVFYLLRNLVPCCRTCHDYLTATYDAVANIAGNTRAGKPDPREQNFFDKCNAAEESYRIAITVKRRRKTGKNKHHATTDYDRPSDDRYMGC
jgi:hypothetical protein